MGVDVSSHSRTSGMPTGLKVSYLSLPSTQARRPASSPRRFLPRLPRLHTSRFLLLFLCSASTITFILVVFPSTLINLQHFSLQSHSHSRESFDPRSLQCRPSSLSHHTPIVINSTTYLSLSPPSRPLPPPRLLPNRPLLPLACLEAQLSLGLQIPCFPPLEEGYPKVDIVWTWVNGSDPIHAETRKDKQKDFYIKASDKMYRDHDELRHSIRSVLQHFRNHTDRFHLLTADFQHPENDTLRIAQVPQWLNLTSSMQDGSTELQFHHHAEFVAGYNGTLFNSFAIESQLSNLCGVTDNFIYLNDDYFFLANLTLADFFSPFGPVLRLLPDLVVRPEKFPLQSFTSEWRPLEYSNWLLGVRFGFRPRPYPTHTTKTSSIPILSELALMFPKEFHTTGLHPFRGHDSTDVYAMFMWAHFLVERWREALLWSWVVARDVVEDGEDGENVGWTNGKWRELGGEQGQESFVFSEERVGLDVERMGEVFANGSYEMPMHTKYVFTSMEGYPYRTGTSLRFNSWTRLQRQCPLQRTDFELKDGEGREGVFKKIAFEDPWIGDCVIIALKNKDPLGLSLFLPKPSLTYIPPSTESPSAQTSNKKIVPHLPLDKDWRTTNFSIDAVFSGFPGKGKRGEINVREWVLRLLERYRFVLGDTPTEFTMLKSAGDVDSLISDLEFKAPPHDPALLCINDDIVPSSRPRIADLLIRKWEGERWPDRAEWELEENAGDWEERLTDEERKEMESWEAEQKSWGRWSQYMNMRGKPSHFRGKPPS